MSESLKEYHGSCLCGTVKYVVSLDFSFTGKCNCTTCWKLRLWYVRAKPENFKIISWEDSLTDFVLKNDTHHQLFCSKCGVHPFHKLNNPKIGGEIVSINICTLDDVSEEELRSFPIKYQDGKNNSWWLEPQGKDLL